MPHLTAEDWVKNTKILPIEKLAEKNRLMLLYRIVKRLCPGVDELLGQFNIGLSRTRLGLQRSQLKDHPCPLQPAYHAASMKDCYENGFVQSSVNLWNSIMMPSSCLKSAFCFKTFLHERYLP